MSISEAVLILMVRVRLCIYNYCLSFKSNVSETPVEQKIYIIESVYNTGVDPSERSLPMRFTYALLTMLNASI